MLLTRIRSAFGFVYGVIHTICFSIIVIAAGLMDRQRLANEMLCVWSSTLLFIFGIRLKVSGEEHLPGSGGGIIVFNHQSHFDIPCLMASTQRLIRFGAKIELFKIPFFGKAMAAIGTLPISRDNRTEVLRIYKSAEKRFHQGVLFVLAPEGTRQSEPKIGRFKKGPFVFAMSAGVPVIPVVIKGAYEVLPKGRLSINLGRWHRTIHIQYLEPVQVEPWKSQPIDALTNFVRAQMVEAYDRTPTPV